MHFLQRTTPPGGPTPRARPPEGPPYNLRHLSLRPSSVSFSPEPSPTAAPSTRLMADEMGKVDEVIRRRLASKVALINQISHYIVSAGGKRIRPQLVLLFANALGRTGDERYELAAIVEFIHTATLLHDDVVDESK